MVKTLPDLVLTYFSNYCTLLSFLYPRFWLDHLASSSVFPTFALTFFHLPRMPIFLLHVSKYCISIKTQAKWPLPMKPVLLVPSRVKPPSQERRLYEYFAFYWYLQLFVKICDLPTRLYMHVLFIFVYPLHLSQHFVSNRYSRSIF